MPQADAAAARQHVPLAPFTTLGVGGQARWLIRATTEEQIEGAERWSAERGVPLFVLGGGSNLVVADAGYRGVVVQIAITGQTFEQRGAETLLHARAGESWDRAVAASVDSGLAGLECLSGIPGTVGGTPVQNVGAYGQEVAATIHTVRAFDRQSKSFCELRAADCQFSYRMSRFKRDDRDRFIVSGVTFGLQRGEGTATYPDVIRELETAGVSTPSVADVRRAVLSVRRRKAMVIDSIDPDTRSVGSFFMNPIVSAAERERVSTVAGAAAPGFPAGGELVKVSAAWLIERAGFARGYRDGAAGISSKHTLALVNRGGATARDVLKLAARIKRAVLDRFGIALLPEPMFVGFDRDPDVDFLQS